MIPESKFSKWQLIRTAVYVAIMLYCAFTVISIGFFPNPFSPLNNYLSQLGNLSLNPNGAIFYNLALILVGLAEIPFYIGLYQWYTKKTENKLLLAARAVGLFNALAIIMSGIFSESVNYSLHIFWSYIIFITFVPILILINKALLTYPEHKKVISYYGFVVAAIHISLIVFVTTMFMGFETGFGPLMEWLAVFSTLAWAGLLAYNTR
jgi:hypothetical protein